MSTGIPGDGLQRDAQAVVRERLHRNVEQPVSVALRIGAQHTLVGRRHGSGSISLARPEHVVTGSEIIIGTGQKSCEAEDPPLN
jgi:hypothetical protein